MRERILEATLVLFGRNGIAKLTLEDVAREAGVSRASLYRHFPGGRDQLIAEVISWEAFRWLGRLAESIEPQDDLEEMTLSAVLFARRTLAEHAVLQKILAEEPELLLPQLTLEATRIVAFIHLYIVTHLFGRNLPPGLDPDAAAEYVARMLLSVVVSPGRWNLDDTAQVRSLVRAELLAALVPAQGTA